MNYHALAVTNIIVLCTHRKDTTIYNANFMLGHYVDIDSIDSKKIYEQLKSYSLVELRNIMYLLTPFYSFNKQSTQAFSLIIQFIEQDINNSPHLNLISENHILKNEIESLKMKLNGIEALSKST